MDNALSVIPLLEVVTSVLLMSRVNSREILHERHHLLLLETLVNEEIVLLMHGSVASLAGSAENFESSAKCGGVPGVPCLEVREVSVSVMETNGVHLFFVTLDTVRCTNVISEDPGLGFMPLSIEEAKPPESMVKVLSSESYRLIVLFLSCSISLQV